MARITTTPEAAGEAPKSQQLAAVTDKGAQGSVSNQARGTTGLESEAELTGKQVK